MGTAVQVLGTMNVQYKESSLWEANTDKKRQHGRYVAGQ